MYKVLIVEDDPMVAMINEQYVSMNKDFSIEGSFRNGQEALSFLEKNGADLVILDVYMPYMSGIEVLKKIRELKIKTEVIMVTAANDTETLEETMHLGVIDYLVKPFALERFQVALEKYSAKVAALKNQSVLDQSLIDDIITNSSKIKSKDYPKGIQEKTLLKVQRYFDSHNGWVTGESLANDLSLSLVTIRHYVNYLVKNNEISESINYETGGRPSFLYKKS